jgi:hypothetical protein
MVQLLAHLVLLAVVGAIPVKTAINLQELSRVKRTGHWQVVRKTAVCYWFA